MNQAFLNVKDKLRNISKLKLPEYKKEFELKTDACNTGLRAVLLQKNSKGELVPVHWASKS